MSDIIKGMLGGLPKDIKKRSTPTPPGDTGSSESDELKRNEFDEFQKATLAIRRKYYNKLKMESVIQDRFIWQILDDAIAKYLNDK